MEMKEDFLDAHQRHWHDAELLFQMQRWANADHLYGFAAECGLKALMEKLKGGFQENEHYGHIMEKAEKKSIWSKYETYISGHLGAGKFSLPDNNPFHDWRASQRYANQACFDEKRARAHQSGAAFVCDLIAEARREGLFI